MASLAIGTAAFLRCALERQPVEPLLEALAAGLALDMALLDTAPSYLRGMPANALARILENYPGLTTVTKVGLKHSESRGYYFDLSKASVLEDIALSAEHLGRPADIALIHHADCCQDTLDQGWAALVAARESGRVAQIGLANCTVADLERISPAAKPYMVQVANSLLEPISPALVDYCRQHEIVLTTHSPRYSGLLSESYTRARVAALAPQDCRKQHPAYLEPALSHNLALVEKLTALGQDQGASAAAVALAWALQEPGVAIVLTGMSSSAQADSLEKARAFSFSPPGRLGLRAP